MKRNVIILLLALCATAAGAWARQVKGGGQKGNVPDATPGGHLKIRSAR